MEIFLLILAVFFILFIWIYIHQKPIPSNTVLAFTGAPGSGKTYIGIRQAMRFYSKKRWLRFFGLIKSDPLFYSNIPVYLGRRWWFFGRKLWSVQLTYQHLVLHDRINEDSVIFIDELGGFADQFSYDNPFVMQYLEQFIRFVRHYIDAYVVITDQSSSNVVVQIRRRINTIYNLSDFRRSWLFFFRVSVAEVKLMEDLHTIQDVATVDDAPYFFGFLPFKYFKKLNKILFPLYVRHYDSRCYSINYKPPVSSIPNSWETYKTDYFIELPNNAEMRKQYKKDGFITGDQMLKYLDAWQTRFDVPPIQGDSDS